MNLSLIYNNNQCVFLKKTKVERKVYLCLGAGVMLEAGVNKVKLLSFYPPLMSRPTLGTADSLFFKMVQNVVTLETV